MSYPTVDLLEAAAGELKNRHPLSVITIPALLRAAKELDTRPTELVPFGSAQERTVLESFKVRDGRKPYVAVWSDPPQLVNDDYAGSTLQRLRTQDILGRSILHDDAASSNRRRSFGLKPGAGRTLAEKYSAVSKACLATWLGRSRQFETFDDLIDWFDQVYPLDGTDLELLYTNDIPEALAKINLPFDLHQADDAAILDRLRPIDATRVVMAPSPEQSGDTEVEGLGWTREVCEYTFREADPKQIVTRVLSDLQSNNIELPNAEELVRRCTMALLVGHLVLQGPPGTGKTTLARALAKGFESKLIETTATSDWSPFHVVGGLRPDRSGGLSPVYGKVTEAALGCAKLVRREVNAEAESEVDQASEMPQGAWLLIDEFNRADIDKAVGSLYTLLSSCDPHNLATTPIDLWFEELPENNKLWVPARFRIIGAMNDLDTSFVNRMSQGLTRRFQFVTVGVSAVGATTQRPVTSEMESAFGGAHSWLDSTYGSVFPIQDRAISRRTLASQIEILQRVVDGLRRPVIGRGWPAGTAQIVDVLRVLLISSAVDPGRDLDVALDWAIGDRLVPQMASISDEQFEVFRDLLSGAGLTESSKALEHLIDPQSIP